MSPQLTAKGATCQTGHIHQKQTRKKNKNKFAGPEEKKLKNLFQSNF
jgi:hypothetical protein